MIKNTIKIRFHAYSIRFHPVRQYCREGTGDAGSRALLVRRQEQKTSQEQGYSRGQPREMFARLLREYARLPKANPLLRDEELACSHFNFQAYIETTLVQKSFT